MIEDLNLYKAFYTVAKYKNISHASEALYVSQPAVSKSIKTLENLLNIKLFLRSSKGVTLTPEGVILYKHIDKAFSEIFSGEHILERLKNSEIGNITLGVSTTIGKNYFLPQFRNFIKKYPHFKIKIINKPTLDTIKLVQEEKIDLGIIGAASVESDDLGFIKVQELHDILVCSREYYENLSLSSSDEIFTKGSFMLLENPNFTRQFIDRYFSSIDIHIQPDIEASNMDFLIECARMGLGITSTLKEFSHSDIHNKKLIEIPVKTPIPSRNIGIIYKNNMSLSIASKSLIEFLK